MIKIVTDRDIPFLDGVFDPFAEVVRLEGRSIGASDVGDADALVVRTRTRCDASLLAGSRVKLVATATIGTDHIDSRWCAENGIRTVNAAGCNARGVLQWVSAVLVNLLSERGHNPADATLGIVGVGHVGGLVKEYAESWGFRTVCCDPPREEREHCGFVSVEEVFAEADIVTLHVPLDASTHHLVGDRLLNSLERKPFIINSSRGEVVDTEALLRSGAGFAADVWEHEPDLDRRMLERAFIATPHIAGYSLQGKANASAAVVAAVAEEFGLPLAGWYPAEVARTIPARLSWEELCKAVSVRYDIRAESMRLKASPQDFELMRNRYDYREEFF